MDKNEDKGKKFNFLNRYEPNYPVQKIPTDLDDKNINFQEINVKDFSKDDNYLKNVHLENIEPDIAPVIPAYYDKESKKLSYNKTTVALVSTIVVIALVVCSIFAVWFFSMNVSDVNAKEVEYQNKLEKNFDKTKDDYESLKKSVTKILNQESKYNRSDLSSILWKIKSYNAQQVESDWFNPYSGEFLKEYLERKDQIDNWYNQLKELMSKDFISSVDSLEVNDEEYKKASEYITAEDKDKIEYTPIESSKAQENLENVYKLSQSIAKEEADFNIFPDQEEYQNLTNKLEDVVSKTEVIYKAALMKELYSSASEKAQKEYDEKVEELTNTIKEEVRKELTQELNESNSKALKEKDDKINSMQREIDAKDGEINSLKERIRNLESGKE